MAGGRPSFYTPEIGEKILSLMEQGLSITASAAECDIARDTVYDWAEKNKEFSDNIKLGRAKRQNFLEKRLLNEDSGPRVTSTIFALKNAAPDDWREKQEIEHSGSVTMMGTIKIDGKPISFEVGGEKD